MTSGLADGIATFAVVAIAVAAVGAMVMIAATIARRRVELVPAAGPTANPISTPTAGVVGSVATGTSAASAELDPTRSIPTLTAALDALSLAVVVADADEAITFQNRSAEEIMSAHDGRALITEAVRRLLVDAVRGEATEREIDLFGPPARTYHIRAVPLMADDEFSPGGRRLSGGVAVIEEITERRRLDQVRRDFVSNIGHELKTPVGAVGLLAETLREEAVSDRPDLETVERFSGRIADEVARLTRTIDDLLALSRIEFGDDLFKESTDVRSVLDDVVSLYRAAARARGVDLIVSCPEGLSARVDRRQVASAVGNLVDNAVKYSASGAIVAVTATERVPGPAPDGDRWLEISVADTGIGIPTSDIDRVFERFYRVDQARSRETGGTGLGLAIVRHVAHNHGGDVGVTSREGQGSTFTLRLPTGDVDAEDADE